MNLARKSSKARKPKSQRVHQVIEHALNDEPRIARDWKMKEHVVKHYLASHKTDCAICEKIYGEEIRAAMFFEYARANPALRLVAEKYRALSIEEKENPLLHICKPPALGLAWLHDKRPQSERPAVDIPNMTEETGLLDETEAWIGQDPWPEIWQSPSFPRKHWAELSGKERAPILFQLRVPKRSDQPLAVNDLRELDDVFTRFLNMAQEAKANKQRRPWPARFTDAHGFEHLLVTVAPYEGATTAGQRFAKLLVRKNRQGKDKGIGKEKAALRQLCALWLSTTRGSTEVPNLCVDVYSDVSAFKRAAKGALSTYRDLFVY